MSSLFVKLYIKESDTSKMVTNTFMPNVTMLKKITRRFLSYIYIAGVQASTDSVIG